MAAKKIFFISDVHLGDGGANDFHKTFQLHRFFDYARENADELVICGDFLELLQSDFMSIYIQHHGILTHLFQLAREMKVSYVIGNHDAAVAVDYRQGTSSNFLGSEVQITPEYENLELGIYVAHGHQFCDFNKKEDILDLSEGSTAGDRIATTIGWIEHHGLPKIENSFGWLEDLYYDYKIALRKLSHDTKKYSQLVDPTHPDYEKLGGDFSEFERGADEILASPRYSVCVFGHTHRQKIRQLKNGIYVNTGSWMGEDIFKSPAIFTSIDAEKIEMINAETFEIIESVGRQPAKKKTRQKVSAK